MQIRHIEHTTDVCISVLIVDPDEMKFTKAYGKPEKLMRGVFVRNSHWLSARSDLLACMNANAQSLSNCLAFVANSCPWKRRWSSLARSRVRALSYLFIRKY